MLALGAEKNQPADEQGVWRALASPIRRHLLDLISAAPRTTGELAESRDGLSRFAVMQHLGVLEEAGLVVVTRRGRQRFNHLNPVPLRRWYERWAGPLSDAAAVEALALERHLNRKGAVMSGNADEIRTVRIASKLRFRCPPQRIFRALTEESLQWFPHTYGEERVRAIVVEPRVGGAHYEDWGGGSGHLYGHVTVYDPPHRFAVRGRIMAGSILDSDYTIAADGDHSTLTTVKVAVGPMTEDEARSIGQFGDLARFEDALRAVVEKQ